MRESLDSELPPNLSKGPWKMESLPKLTVLCNRKLRLLGIINSFDCVVICKNCNVTK